MSYDRSLGNTAGVYKIYVHIYFFYFHSTMNNMTKRLPQIQNYPYKYQEVRRKFRTEVKGGKNIDSIKEEEGRLIQSREKTNLAISNSNLGVSRENLGASQDSLNKGETVRVRNPLHGSHDNLRTDISQRQTSLENLKRREENGKNVYSFSLQKADRSYSEPVLFPPVREHKHIASQNQGQGQSSGNIKVSTSQVYAPVKENTFSVPVKDKKPFPVKFPIVTRSDLYKHLGMAPDGRKKKRPDEGNKNIRDSNYGLPKHILQIMPESGGSRHVALSSNIYGKDAEPMPKNKVEMYKQWHEEQSRKRVKRQVNQNEVTKDAVRLATMYREKYNVNDIRGKQQSRAREGTLPKMGGRNPPGNRSNAPSRIAESTTQNKGQMGPRPESPPAAIPEELKNRIYSAKTWKTWRDINTSYAYVDVKEYIEDNELMDEEKEEWIKDWIMDVDRKYFHPEPDDSDEEPEKAVQEENRNSQSDKTSQSRSQSDQMTQGDGPIENGEREPSVVIVRAEENNQS